MKIIYLVALSLLIVAGCSDGESLSTNSIFSDRCVFSHNIDCTEFELDNNTLHMTLHNKGLETIEIKNSNVYLLGPETDRISRNCELTSNTLERNEFVEATCEMRDISNIRRNTFRVFMDASIDGETVRIEGDLFFTADK